VVTADGVGAATDFDLPLRVVGRPRVALQFSAGRRLESFSVEQHNWGNLRVTQVLIMSSKFNAELGGQETASGFQVVNDVAGGNVIGSGTTGTSWNLQ
jgi:hypothetical protein